MNDKFGRLGLKQELVDNLQELKFNSMTPIQSAALPLVMEGQDIIAQAKTGSGKTAVFGLGILNSLDIPSMEIQSLVLSPTRELAEQVAQEIRTLARKLPNIKVLTITGGQSEYQQERSLDHGAHIIVGTPGRILRLINKGTLLFNTVNRLILDEADRMLDMGFHDDILKIVDRLPKKRHTHLFSATFPEEIKGLGQKLQYNAQVVEVDTDHAQEIIEQLFFKLASHKDKPDALLKVLGHYRPKRFIIFCKTKQITDSVAKHLDRNNISVRAIHGDIMQNERNAALTMFSNYSLSALVATDVAARGLDIDDLELVINFDLPETPEIYVHRVGRTARAGKRGAAISFFVVQELPKVDAIFEVKKMTLQQQELDTLQADSSYDLVPDMGTIYISRGKRDKLRPGDIAGTLVGQAGIDFKEIGKISVTNTTSFVAIKSDLIDGVVKKLRNAKIKKLTFKVGKL
jgi:ATP-dependent RNA helicase DbpA